MVYFTAGGWRVCSTKPTPPRGRRDRRDRRDRRTLPGGKGVSCRVDPFDAGCVAPESQWQSRGQVSDRKGLDRTQGGKLSGSADGLAELTAAIQEAEACGVSKNLIRCVCLLILHLCLHLHLHLHLRFHLHLHLPRFGGCSDVGLACA
jgi:hypothetical protein